MKTAFGSRILHVFGLAATLALMSDAFAVPGSHPATTPTPKPTATPVIVTPSTELTKENVNVAVTGLGKEQLERECRDYQANPTGPVPSGLRAEADLCQRKFDFFMCDKVTAKWPALHDRLRKCDALSLCQGNGSPLSALFGWGKGFATNTVDTAVAIGNFAWEKGVLGTQFTLDMAAKCDALLECKRAAAEMVPWRRGISDEELKGFSSLYLVAEWKISEGLDALGKLGSSAVDCVTHPETWQQTSQQAGAAAGAQANAINDWLQENTLILGLRYNCLDAQGQGELVGYTTAYFIDPLAAAAAIGKSKFLLEAMQISKDGLVEAAVSGLKPRDQAESGGPLPSSALSAADSATAAAKAEVGVDRRASGETMSRKPGEARPLQRDTFVSENLNRAFTTPEQNAKFVALADMTVPDGKTRFLDVENSLMKKLNDTTRDKNLVTSLTNRHKELLFEKLKALEAANPGLELVPYSDFKSVRVAIRGKVPADLDGQLQALFKQANEEFGSEVDALGLVRRQDKPDTWFRGGLGLTADQANLAARSARAQGALENRMLDYSSPAVNTRLAGRLTTAESSRATIATELAGTPLLQKVGEKQILSREAFDLVRKYSSPETLRAAVQKRYGLTSFSTDQAEAMLDYAKAVDEFSPGIHVIEREIVSLDEAAHGGFSIDFLGLGSANQNATAAALANASDLNSAVALARQGEKTVTTEFQARVSRFKEIAGKFAKCTGDDCAGIADAAMTSADKHRMVDQLVADDRTRGIRVAFIADGIPVAADRTALATHGESIEKFLRKSLEGKIPSSRLSNAIFALDMKTTKANTGAVELIVGTREGLRWTPQEWETMQKALKEAIEAHNRDLAKENIVSTYKASYTPCSAGAGLSACAPENLLSSPP